ncbi:Iron-regulated ABC transporter permease protein SufD [[Leptolyngbya] sp. PCC 7376]|uniref:Fe-S cluster assembly protein SufD n=1 Tax=[Leptolyngbya] sp. PCC 7376 TaxID=111781 RepID=UPI00029EFC16|nr:Fe-S cluster assembly protein SufD [[Leptolyngbya] sp. PCC 7376]AFY36607.1 Iron-regulated ABC transporter permease protein SufD [[Leptolyngbya] sp. PCC 7376]
MAKGEQAIASFDNPITMLDLSLSPLLQLAETNKTVFNQGSTGWLKELRTQGAYKVSHAIFPTKRDEDWRVTDISTLRATRFLNAKTYELDAADIATELVGEAIHQLVFVNGKFSAELSNTEELPEGLFVGNLAQLSADQAEELIKYIGVHSRERDVFAALNNAGFHDVAIIWAEKNVVVEAPIQVLFVNQAAGRPTAMQTRCLAIASPSSSFSLIEQYVGRGSGEQTYFNNALTEIFVQENAEIKHVRVQQEIPNATHISNTIVGQSQHSRYSITEVNLGGKLSRHSLTIHQEGVQTETNLKGLAILDGEQVCDTHSDVQLNFPHGTVDQLHKCIVDDSARSVFNGRVCVPQNAQMTNAAQLNRNLLLSSKARVDTKPELEITADNVKCAHGATVSQLEADEIFYLRSRGLDENAARYLLVDAFATEILAAITIPSLREKISKQVRIQDS